MKRSEMESILESYLVETDLDDIRSSEDYYARKILSIVESAGMLPPVVSLCDGEDQSQKETRDMFEQAWDDYLARWEEEEES